MCQRFCAAERSRAFTAGFCDVALVIGADTTPKGFPRPWAASARATPTGKGFHLIGATNTVYFRAAGARRRMDLYGATVEDFLLK